MSDSQPATTRVTDKDVNTVIEAKQITKDKWVVHFKSLSDGWLFFSCIVIACCDIEAIDLSFVEMEMDAEVSLYSEINE